VNTDNIQRQNNGKETIKIAMAIDDAQRLITKHERLSGNWYF
jgi:hypothetical protein